MSWFEKKGTAYIMYLTSFVGVGFSISEPLYFIGSGLFALAASILYSNIKVED